MRDTRHKIQGDSDKEGRVSGHVPYRGGGVDPPSAIRIIHIKKKKFQKFQKGKHFPYKVDFFSPP